MPVPTFTNQHSATLNHSLPRSLLTATCKPPASVFVITESCSLQEREMVLGWGACVMCAYACVHATHFGLVLGLVHDFSE